MSRLAAAHLMISAILAVAALAAAEAPASVVAYDFDSVDPAVSVVSDSSGNGLDGTLVNGSTAVVDGAAGGHPLPLPGGAPTSTGAYVTLPRGVLAGRTDLTVSVRVRRPCRARSGRTTPTATTGTCRSPGPPSTGRNTPSAAPSQPPARPAAPWSPPRSP